MRTPRIVVTSGEPAGIGPDICVMLAQESWPCELIFAGDAAMMADTAAALRIALTIVPYDPKAAVQLQRAGVLRILDIRAPAPIVAGQLAPQNAAYVLALLDRACDGCMSGEFAAMVTAPVQKSIIMQAGFAFTGHTEYLAQRCGVALPVMMLVAGRLRVALITTHLPLSEVPAAITQDKLEATLRILHDGLIANFALAAPRILLLGLNPHAGESGHLGREEIEVIEPVARRLRSAGMSITGPVPADTAFTPLYLDSADVVVAMYHDQGLPVLKHSGFGEAVNITLGLPIVRTSVDHGTALPLARSGKADAGSLRAALKLALQMAQARA